MSIELIDKTSGKKIGTVFSSGVIAYNITFSGRFI